MAEKCLLSNLSTVDFKFSGIDSARILIQLAEILKKIHFYKAIQKQICGAHKFMQHVLVFPAITSCAVILPHTGVIAVEAS
jgi:hypothetical protein